MIRQPPKLLAALGLLAAGPVWGAVSGTLETRLQYDSYFERESYLEQWVDLDYRNRDGAAAGLLAVAGSGRGAALTNLHRLFVSKRFAAAAPELDLKLGRFERSDAAGLYTLDGLSLGWRRGAARWELFG